MKKEEPMTEEGKMFPSAAPAARPSTAASMLSPLDVQQKEFRVSRFGGYKMRDVDEFLDQITDAFSALIAENERIRGGVGGAAGRPIVGEPDLDDVARQADEIIQRARDEAAQIVAQARSVAGVAGAPVTEQERTAVNAFLAREREFLQSLAGLVQDHAEAVKGMAKAARPAPASTKPSPTQAPPPPAQTPTPQPPAQAPASSTSSTESSKASGPATPAPSEAEPLREPAAAKTDAPGGSSDPTTRIPEAEEPVHVEEPAPAAITRSDADDESRENTEGRDGSLRELFWGED